MTKYVEGKEICTDKNSYFITKVLKFDQSTVKKHSPIKHILT